MLTALKYPNIMYVPVERRPHVSNVCEEMKVMKGVSCKELKREVGSETARVHGVHRGFVVGNNTGK